MVIEAATKVDAYVPELCLIYFINIYCWQHR